MCCRDKVMVLSVCVSVCLLPWNLLPTLFIHSKQNFIGCFMVLSRFYRMTFTENASFNSSGVICWSPWRYPFSYSKHNTVGQRWLRPLTHSWSLHKVAAHSGLHVPRVPEVEQEDSPTHPPHPLIMHCNVTMLNEYYCLTNYVDQQSSMVAHSCLRGEPIS